MFVLTNADKAICANDAKCYCTYIIPNQSILQALRAIKHNHEANDKVISVLNDIQSKHLHFRNPRLTFSAIHKVVMIFQKSAR